MPNEINNSYAEALSSVETRAAAEFVSDEPSRNLGDLFAILLRGKWLILAVTAAGALGSAAIALRIPNSYTATAVILPPQQAQSSASALLGQLGPIAAMAGRDMGLRSPADLYLGLLGSRTIADRVIGKFGLREVYGVATATDARAKLRSRARFSSGRDTLIRIEIEDADPGRAAAMANMFTAELNEQNRNFAISEATQRRQFLEQRLADARNALARAEDAMKQMQSHTGLIQLDAQSSVAIGSAAQLKAQITAGEVALERLKMGATTQNPEVLRLEAELDALRAQLRKTKTSGQGIDDGSLIGTSKLPQAGIEYIRQLRELKYNEFLFELLSKQYEAARIDESKASPALQIVDAAVPPDKKSGPHRTIITLFGVFGGLLLGCALAFMRQGREPGGER